MDDQLIDTWRIHCRVNLYLLGNIHPDVFGLPKPKKGRGVAQMLAHIHNVRLLWLETAVPELMDRGSKIGKEADLTPDLLRDSLTASGEAIAELLEKAAAAGGKVRGFKPHAVAFVGYLIAHESYHHGEIGVALTVAGYPLEQKVAYGLWEWGKR